MYFRNSTIYVRNSSDMATDKEANRCLNIYIYMSVTYVTQGTQTNRTAGLRQICKTPIWLLQKQTGAPSPCTTKLEGTNIIVTNIFCPASYRKREGNHDWAMTVMIDSCECMSGKQVTQIQSMYIHMHTHTRIYYVYTCKIHTNIPSDRYCACDIHVSVYVCIYVCMYLCVCSLCVPESLPSRAGAAHLRSIFECRQSYRSHAARAKWQCCCGHWKPPATRQWHLAHRQMCFQRGGPHHGPRGIWRAKVEMSRSCLAKLKFENRDGAVLVEIWIGNQVWVWVYIRIIITNHCKANTYS